MGIRGAPEGIPRNLEHLLFVSGLGRALLNLGVIQDLEDVVERIYFLALRPQGKQSPPGPWVLAIKETLMLR